MYQQIMNLGSCPWRMRSVGSDHWHAATVPGSVYSDLLADGTIPDPFYRDNELAAFELMKQDWEYVCTFTMTAEALAHRRVELVCEGLDTLADVILNGSIIAHADNMHITWNWDVQRCLQAGENELRIIFRSPINYCAEAAARAPGWESSDATPGFRHLRKAHCMFGWDGAPVCPMRACGGPSGCACGIRR